MSRQHWRYITDKSAPGVDFERYLVNDWGQVWDQPKNYFLHQPVDEHGYLKVHLHTANGFKMFYVHRIEKIEHHGFDPDPLKTQVDHKDGIKKHNYLWNLEWVYPHENTHRALKNNLCPHINNVVDEDDVRFICEQLKLGKSYGEISDMLYPKTQTDLRIVIGNIYRGGGWTSISKEYMPFPDKLDQTYYTAIRTRANSHITEDMAHEICKRLESGERSMDIAEDFVNRYAYDFNSIEHIIGSIRQGRSWKHISSLYKVPKGTNSRRK